MQFLWGDNLRNCARYIIESLNLLLLFSKNDIQSLPKKQFVNLMEKLDIDSNKKVDQIVNELNYIILKQKLWEQEKWKVLYKGKNKIIDKIETLKDKDNQRIFLNRILLEMICPEIENSFKIDKIDIKNKTQDEFDIIVKTYPITKKLEFSFKKIGNNVDNITKTFFLQISFENHEIKKLSIKRIGNTGVWQVIDNDCSYNFNAFYKIQIEYPIKNVFKLMNSIIKSHFEELKEFIKVKKDKDQLTKDKDQLTKDKDQLTKDKDQLTKDKDQLTKDKDQLTKDKDQLTKKNKNLVSENNDFKKKLDKVQKYNNSIILLFKELKEIKDQILSLEKAKLIEKLKKSTDCVNEVNKIIKEKVKPIVFEFDNINEFWDMAIGAMRYGIVSKKTMNHLYIDIILETFIFSKELFILKKDIDKEKKNSGGKEKNITKKIDDLLKEIAIAYDKIKISPQIKNVVLKVLDVQINSFSKEIKNKENAKIAKELQNGMVKKLQGWPK